MSGTSLDGVDAALGDFRGGGVRLKATHFLPFSPKLRGCLASLQASGNDELHTAAVCGNELARLYAQAVTALLAGCGVPAEAVAAIGCHGQTVRHRPELGYTIQINQPALLAELTGITVVADFRSRDLAAGGQGAPLVPAFHQAAFGSREPHRLIVNIGGMANLTDLPPGGPVTGFDTGPGNALMDGWIELNRGETFDRDGAWAESGKVLDTLLKALLDHEFFRRPPPKSTGRDAFNLDWLKHHLSGKEAPADVQATLLALTADTIADAAGRYCGRAREVYLCGGGARNLALLRRLQKALAGKRVALTDELGIGADWVEALAFAWLARAALRKEPGNLPSVTGAKGPRVLGAIYPQ